MTSQYEKFKKIYIADANKMKKENCPHVFGYITENDQIEMLSLETSQELFNNHLGDIKNIFKGYTEHLKVKPKMVFYFSETYYLKVDKEDKRDQSKIKVSEEFDSKEALIIYEEGVSAIKTTIYDIIYDTKTEYKTLENTPQEIIIKKSSKDYKEMTDTPLVGFL